MKMETQQRAATALLFSIENMHAASEDVHELIGD